MGPVILYLLGVVTLPWGLLKLSDWIHAVLYERRRLKQEAAQAAYNRGYADALGAYAKQPVQSYRITLATPDRPVDPVDRPDPIRQQIDALTATSAKGKTHA